MSRFDFADAETMDPRQARRERPPRFVLRLVFDGGTGVPVDRLYAPAVGAVAIGRGVDDAGILLREDLRASRRHAVLHVEDGGRPARIVNESRHGTLVNGKPVDAKALADGDVVRCGDSLFVARVRTTEGLDAPAPRVVGVSDEARALRSTIALVGPTKATALVLGETGTGKEVCARALHDASGRGGPFVAVNCGAIPETLAEAELFGHTQGAFTGAAKEDPGLVRAADGGTLFLDEVADLSPAVQTKLLRVLDVAEVVAVGARKATRVDVRVVAATNKDLQAAIDDGKFRADLYARLAEITIDLPPLRKRRDDVLALTASALGPGARMTADLAHALLLHPWPFNVREVFKVATELLVRGQGRPALDVDLVEGRLSKQQPVDDDDAGVAKVPAQDELEALLRAHRGNLADVARATGRSRRQVARWLEKYGLDPDAFRRA